MSRKSVEEHLQQPYTIEVMRDNNPENPGWVARVVELPGVITQADTFEELEGMIQDAMRGWIEVALEDGEEIPEPRREEDYSGKFIVRVPKSLHRRLALAAEREGVSLNQFVSTVLASAVGSPAGITPAAPQAAPHEIRAWITEAVQQLTRAKAMLKKNDFQAALEAAEKGLDLAGKGQAGSVREGSGYYHPTSFYYIDRNELEAAQAQQESDPRPGLLLAKVDALTGLGRLDDALETLRLYPSEIIYYRYAAALLLKMDRPQDALAQLKAARKARVQLDQPTKQLEKKIKDVLAREK